jgi:nucleoside-diphosphate-sugar epimerase
MQKLLVTGVTGFLGSEVLARIVADERSSKICVLARKKADTQKSLLAQRFREKGLDPARIDALEWIEVPFEDESRFRQALEALPTQDNWRVLHMAAIIKSSKNNTAVERLNLGVTRDLLEFSNLRRAPFYYTSSVVAFGTTADRIVRTESDFHHWELHNKLYPYYSTKRAAHEWIMENARVPGWLFCPSIVHGSLEGSKNSRDHLKALREGRLKFAPSGGANFVALKDVARPIAETVLSGFLQGKAPQARLLVGPNLRFTEYFNLYLDVYREHLESKNTNQTVIPERSVSALPPWVGSLAHIKNKFLRSMGAEFAFLDSLAQSSKYLYFDSIYRQAASLPGLDDLRVALRQSIDNP